jgi:hypothetical protein
MAWPRILLITYFEAGDYLQALWVKVLDSPGKRFEIDDLHPLS